MTKPCEIMLTWTEADERSFARVCGEEKTEEIESYHICQKCIRLLLYKPGKAAVPVKGSSTVAANRLFYALGSGVSAARKWTCESCHAEFWSIEPRSICIECSCTGSI